VLKELYMNEFVIDIEPYVNETVDLSSETIKQLEKLAKEKNRTVEELIREVLDYKFAKVVELNELSLYIKETCIVTQLGKPVGFYKPIKIK